MMKARQYHSAVKVLKSEIERKGGKSVETERRALGECYYLLGDYSNARVQFANALPLQKKEAHKIICESRLAMIAYRFGDTRGAVKRIDAFTLKYPKDKRTGTLLLIKMKLLAAQAGPAKNKIAGLEVIQKQIAKRRNIFGYYSMAMANKVMGEQLVLANRDEDAVALFVDAVRSMDRIMLPIRQKGGVIPSDLRQGYDAMCTQIAKVHIDKKDWSQAQKWLQSVGYDPALKQQAKFLMAQMAFKRGRPDDVPAILTKEVLEGTDDARVLNTMYLLLGMAHKEGKRKDPEKAKYYLKMVKAQGGENATHYQAQHMLGNIYIAQNDFKLARDYFAVSVKSPKYEAPALFYLGRIYKQEGDIIDGEDAAAVKKRHESYGKAATIFGLLVSRYPLTEHARNAKPYLDELQVKGVKVSKTQAQEDKVAGWLRTTRQSPKTSMAAQALMSLAQQYSQKLYDEKGESVAQAPDWIKVAKHCDRLLLSEKEPYQGVSEERWNELMLHAHLLRGKAELGSLPPGRHARPEKGEQPVLLTGGGNAGRAADHFRKATERSANATREIQKDIELSLLEAMFKSDKPEDREQAEKRYADLEDEYGGDPRYQKLALDLAQWFVDQGRFDLAASSYRGLSRSGDLDRDQVMQLLQLAGTYYSRAAKEALDISDAGDITCALYVYPAEVFKSPTVLQTHRPLRAAKSVVLKAGAETRKDVLLALSESFGVPFTWSPDQYKGGVAAWLAEKIARERLDLLSTPRQLREHLADVLDLDRFVLDFDIGVSGGKPTLDAQPVDVFDRGAVEHAKVIEIYDRERERFRQMERAYDWRSHGGKSVMLFHMVKRVQDLAGANIVWAETVDKDSVLATEYIDLPGDPKADPNKVSCGSVLRRTLKPLGLKFRPIRYDKSKALFEDAKGCFSELRQFGTDTGYVEQALYQLAINYYFQQDYEKMRLVLREYLKVFDSPEFPHFFDAAFWLGWAFEYDRNYREAIKRYGAAIEESLVLYKLEPDSDVPDLDEVTGFLNYDSQVALGAEVVPALAEYDLEKFTDFVRFNSNVELKLDSSVENAEIPDALVSSSETPCLSVLHDVMKTFQLGLRSENSDKKVAEKAYYRLASVYRKDNLMQEALENINTLLLRFPQTSRRLDALKMKVDIYKGLKDYASVLEALEQLKKEAGGKIEAYKLDYESGRVYFDMCEYENAVKFYKKGLSAAKDGPDRLKIREAYGQALAQMEGKRDEAVAQYRTILNEEKGPLRLSVARLMVFHLANDGELPTQEAEFIQRYGQLTPEQFAGLSENDYARATWIYYVLALRHMAENEFAAALKKLDACGNSPDDFLAGQALMQAGLLRMKLDEVKKARETFEHMLFVVKSVNATVSATYHLGLCHAEMGNLDRAYERLNEVVTRFPISPFAEKARQHEIYKDGSIAPPEQSAQSHGKKEAGDEPPDEDSE
jgi:tetratricopeptide (TPR) repeat protein